MESEQISAAPDQADDASASPLHAGQVDVRDFASGLAQHRGSLLGQIPGQPELSRLPSAGGGDRRGRLAIDHAELRVNALKLRIHGAC
jgi:hypothetical protein